MASFKQHTLTLKIKDHRGTFQRNIDSAQKLTVGLAPENDIVIFDDEYPKSHVLLEHRKNRCVLYIHPKMRGAIRYKDSTITFQDLIVQNILPRRGDFYVLEFDAGRKGIVEVDNTRVGFLYDGTTTTKSLPKYSWFAAWRRALSRDMLFKLLLVLFLGLEIYWVFFLQGIELPPQSMSETESVPQRFARFVIREPEPQPVIASEGFQEGPDVAEETVEEESSEPQQSTDTDRPQSASESGLLGLLG